MMTGKISGLARAAYYRVLCLDTLRASLDPSDSMVHCAVIPDAGNLREASELRNCMVLVARGHFSRSAVHITTTETGRGHEA